MLAPLVVACTVCGVVTTFAVALAATLAALPTLGIM
jgi:hypothetical protein